MNPVDLERLDAWRHGRISEDEFRVLQERLEADADLRAALRALAEVEEGLSALALAKMGAAPTSPRVGSPTGSGCVSIALAPVGDCGSGLFRRTAGMVESRATPAGTSGPPNGAGPRPG